MGSFADAADRLAIGWEINAARDFVREGLVIGQEPVVETDDERDDHLEDLRYLDEWRNSTRLDDHHWPGTIDAWFEAGEPDDRD